MHTLGIGRNMVKSIQFWGEATGVIRSREGHGHRPGPVGDRLFGRAGWDEYLETLESLWLLHWWITTKASLAAWDEVFGEGGLQRFDKRGLVEALARRGEGKARTLVASTLEQHASIFLQTYYQESRGIDDTSWCPLQDLALLTASRDNEGQVAFATNLKAPVGLTLRLFSAALVEFLAGYEGQTVALSEVLRSAYSPGIVFGLDEGLLRVFLNQAVEGPLRRALKFNDTADTQSLRLDAQKVDPELRFDTVAEIAHA